MPSPQRTTSRPTTDALSRGARWVRATRAHTGRPSVRIAGRPMGRGQMPVLPRRGPACPPGGKDHHPLHAGRGGRGGPWRPLMSSLPRRRPRPPRGKRVWARRRSRRGRREGRPRLPWRWGSRWLGLLSFFSFLFVLVRVSLFFIRRGWGEGDWVAPVCLSWRWGQGLDCVLKSGRMGALSVRAAASRCHSPSGCMQWDSK